MQQLLAATKCTREVQEVASCLVFVVVEYPAKKCTLFRLLINIHTPVNRFISMLCMIKVSGDYVFVISCTHFFE